MTPPGLPGPAAGMRTPPHTLSHAVRTTAATTTAPPGAAITMVQCSSKNCRAGTQPLKAVAAQTRQRQTDCHGLLVTSNRSRPKHQNKYLLRETDCAT